MTGPVPAVSEPNDEEKTIESGARASAIFPPLGTTPRQARAFVRAIFADWHITDPLDDVLLLTTELVTNGVVHAGTDVEVVIETTGVSLIVSVGDRYSARQLPTVVTAPPEMSESGRGLLLIRSIANRWGVEHSATGKAVWFETLLSTAAVVEAVESASGAAPHSQSQSVLIAAVGVDETGVVTGWRGDAAQLLGWTEDQVLGRHVNDFIPAAGRHRSLHDQVARSGRWHGSVDVRCADGSSRSLYGSHRLAADSGDLLCLWTLPSDRWALAPAAPGSAATPSGVADILGLADSVTARLSLDDLLDQVLRRSCTAFGSDAAYILLADEDGGFELRAAYGFTVDSQALAGARSTEGIAGLLGVHNLPVIVDDTSEPNADPLLTGQGMRSAVATPLVVEGRMAGSLHVAARRPNAFTTDDGVRLAQVSDRVALAVESARLNELERRRRGWLAYVAEASDLLAGTLDLDRTLALVSQLVVPTLGSWCAIHLLEEGGDSRLAYVWHADEARGDELRKALAALPAPERRTVARQPPPNRRQPWRPALEHSLSAYDRIIYPLVARNNVVGSLTVGRAAAAQFRTEEIDLAGDLARRSALAIDNAQLFQERVVIATALQRSLLPPEAPVIQGCEIGVAYLAAGEGNEVGGDFYDVFPIGTDRWGVAIGDVCGKGAEAAAVTGLARHTIRLLGRDGRRVAEVLERLNRAILEEGPRARFVTVAYAVMTRTPAGATVELCSAGHPLPMLIGVDGTVRPLGEPQSLLGVMSDPALTSQFVDIGKGESLVFFTDGVTERREGTRMLGEDGLARVLGACASLPASAIARRIERAVIEWQPEPSRDDMAVVVVRVL